MAFRHYPQEAPQGYYSLFAATSKPYTRYHHQTKSALFSKWAEYRTLISSTSYHSRHLAWQSCYFRWSPGDHYDGFSCSMGETRCGSSGRSRHLWRLLLLSWSAILIGACSCSWLVIRLIIRVIRCVSCIVIFITEGHSFRISLALRPLCLFSPAEYEVFCSILRVFLFRHRGSEL